MPMRHSPSLPLTFISIVQATGAAVPVPREGKRGTMYATPTHLLINGLDGKNPRALVASLRALTSADYAPKYSQFYLFFGKLVVPNADQNPIIYYNPDRTLPIPGSLPFGRSLENTTSVVGFGIVTQKKLQNQPSMFSAAITMKHIDYDWQTQVDVVFHATYWLPSNTSVSSTINLFQLGRQMVVAGTVVDWDEKTNGFMILINHVSVASGGNVNHNISNNSISQSSGPVNPQAVISRRTLINKDQYLHLKNNLGNDGNHSEKNSSPLESPNSDPTSSSSVSTTSISDDLNPRKRKTLTAIAPESS